MPNRDYRAFVLRLFDKSHIVEDNSQKTRLESQLFATKPPITIPQWGYEAKVRRTEHHMLKKRRLLAVGSSGGHWDELMVISPSFEGFFTIYATTNPEFVNGKLDDVRIIADCNRWRPIESIRCAINALALVRSVSPDVVITTGAAPGAFALLFGKLMGARTIWVDGLGSASQLSMSGKLTLLFADLHLTQWRHLAGKRTRYMGSVL